MTQEQALKVAARFIEYLESGAPPEGLFAPDLFCDFTSPRWRQQAVGLGPVLELRRRGHPSPGKVPRFRCDPTPTGFVLELEEQWTHGGQDWYCRELFRADVHGERITCLSVYCTGDWDAQRRAEHASAVQLLRP
jgi:hypothetical protein